MPNDRVTRSSPLLEVVRGAVRTRTGIAVDTAKKSPRQTPPQDIRAPLNVLRTRLNALLNGVDANDAHAVALTRAPVLQEILLWEFGDNFRQDAQFAPMVEALNNMLDTDEGFREHFSLLMANLTQK